MKKNRARLAEWRLCYTYFWTVQWHTLTRLMHCRAQPTSTGRIAFIASPLAFLQSGPRLAESHRVVAEQDKQVTKGHLVSYNSEIVPHTLIGT